VGFIKGVIPVFDFKQIDKDEDNLSQLQGIKNKITTEKGEERNKVNEDFFKIETDKIKTSITAGLAIKMDCNFCNGPISGKPKVLKFADIARFFCYVSCKYGYSEKYRGRMESIKRKYEGKDDL
jgi:hypothetical protein